MTLYYGAAVSLPGALRAGVEQAVAAGHRVGVLATRDDAAMLRGMPVVVADIGAPGDMAAIAARLYAALRELDAQHVDVIFARMPAADDPLARAVRDRLHRAAARAVRVD
jgi:hypothetical protein